jgi:hypothetical protein
MNAKCDIIFFRKFVFHKLSLVLIIILKNMKIFTISGFLFLLMTVSQVFAQVYPDDPNLDQIPQYLRDRASQTVQSDAPLSTVVTIDNWDNYSLGVDFAENNIAEHPSNPQWYFTAYNTNAPHHTENGIDWFNHSANFGTSVQGDPVVAYDSIGNLFYENMFGNITGCKVIKSVNNGVAWTPSVTAISGNDKNWMACDQTSGPYANYVYTVMTNNGVGNFARSTDNGATFASTYTATPHTLPGMMVAVGPQGNTQGGAVYIVTNSGGSFSAVYTFFRSNDGGATFTQRSTAQWANTVGSQVGGRNSVSNMRTRPYPMIAADNSYGTHRGNLYCVYASNNPPSTNGFSDVWCRTSSDGGATWSSAVRVNDDNNAVPSQQWHPAIWSDKETGKLYVMWMDTRDTPTNDSAFIYATYSEDGGATFVANQQISNKKMKINCSTCGGGGTPRYQGDYNGIVSNSKVSMVAWTDFRSGTFQSMTGYFPDFAMAIDHAADTLYTASDNTTFMVSVPEVKLYTDTVVLSADITPVPTTGSITFEFPSGNTITSFPSSKPVKVVLAGNVVLGTYSLSFYAKGPNGTPVHRRTATLRVLQGNNFTAEVTANPEIICQGQSSQLSTVVIGGAAPLTYTWTPATGLNDPAISNPIATPDVTTTYRVVVTDNSANSATDSVTIVVNTPPEAPGPVTGNQSVCAGDTVSYSIVEVAGGTIYSWSVIPPADSIIGNGTPQVTIIWGNTSGEIQVLAGNNCGNNPVPAILPVSVNLPPTALNPIEGPDGACINAVATFTTPVAGSPENYIWTVPADAVIASGQGTNTIDVTWGATAGDVTVFAQNNCGETPVIMKSVTIMTIPDPAGTIAGQDTVCQGSGNQVYNVPSIPGASTYIWSLPEGVTITAGSGTNEVTLQYSNTALSGNISVKGSNDCGDGAESSLAVLVKNCTGIDQKGLESTVRIYPNPVSSELTISISGKERQLTLTLTNAAGQVVWSETLESISGDYMKKLDMSRFAKGVYVMKLSNNGRTHSEKLIVQ